MLRWMSTRPLCWFLLAAVSFGAAACSDEPPAPHTETSASFGSFDKAANARAAEPALPNIAVTQDDLPRVAFLGDNIAAGQYLAEEQAFPSILQRRLRGRGAGFTLINASVSGDTTSAGLRRLDWLLKQQPSVVVIELGENDVGQAVPVATIEANLLAIVSKLRAAKVQPLLLGATPPHAAASDYARAVEAMYARLAAEPEIAFVPKFMQGVAGHRELTLPDGVQPTPEGHERIAGNLAEPLRVLIQQ